VKNYHTRHAWNRHSHCLLRSLIRRRDHLCDAARIVSGCTQ